MKLKKIIAVALTAIMTMSLTACGGSETKDGTSSSTGDSGKTYNIGICQLVQHDALDAATKGFKDALTEKLGDKVKFDEQNAQGDSPTCATIVNSFVSEKVDLILANATAPLQAAVAGATDIPILGTSVTDYGTALDIKDWKGTTGINVSGTSDLAPLDQQAAMIKELFPDKKKVGLFYCSAEANSLYQVETIKTYLEKEGYTCTNYSFVDSNDIASVITNASKNSEIIYIPTDNTAASNTEVIKNTCVPAKVPVVAGEQGICSGCGVATLSISYYDLGYETGKMAYEVLVNGADVSTMEIKFAPKVTKQYNESICKELGINIPEGYEKIEASK
ncbi:MAG: ABC transporter substrate-binding protein [Eubacterium sp.]|nr:ABC transporter substrate-binding protein [Eubacterium sp.]